MSYQMTDIIYLKFSINSRYVFFNQPTLLSLFLVTEPLFTIKNAFFNSLGGRAQPNSFC